jgi:hypothetical protein
MGEYPENDFPWTLYFQGKAMPRWSNCWHFQPVPDGKYDWYLDRVQTRLHHVGQLESDEAGIFLIAAQEVLIHVIDHKQPFLEGAKDLSDPPESVYESFISGLCAMIQIAETESVVFWTSGYEADDQMVTEAVRRFQLGAAHPDYLVPPHRIAEQTRIESNIEWQRKDLRRRSQQRGVAKELKRFLHDLPKRTS